MKVQYKDFLMDSYNVSHSHDIMMKPYFFPKPRSTSSSEYDKLIKSYSKLSSLENFVLFDELFSFRDELAKARDKPRQKVLTHEQIAKICVESPKTIGELEKLISSIKYWNNSDKMKVIDCVAQHKSTGTNARRLPMFCMSSDSESDESFEVVVNYNVSRKVEVCDFQCPSVNLQNESDLIENACKDAKHSVIVENENVILDEGEKMNVEIECIDLDEDSIELVESCKNIPTIYDRIDSVNVNDITDDDLLANWDAIRRSKMPKYLQNYLRTKRRKHRRAFIHAERERKGMTRIDFHRRGKIDKRQGRKYRRP
ncbi:unnamed protein product [Orchesella dallaii]|uniref:HRDC domain-containing protein n=1 Tax=Orchesella dallaii TaxID=48710 RepID=A0ABP1RV43_9HEXA